jgi:arylsulfatase A-like enzyme
VEHVPKGYDWWLGLKGNSRYYNYTLSVNGTGHFFQSDYLTDQITYYALNFLNEKSVAEGSFFMMLAPPACHAPFTPAPRHEELYPDLLTVRDPAFNATPVDKHWLVQMPPTSLPEDVTNLDEIYRNRIRTLLSVDDMVGAVVEKLEELKILNNTYVIVMSDNGFHIGKERPIWGPLVLKKSFRSVYTTLGQAGALRERHSRPFHDQGAQHRPQRFVRLSCHDCGHFTHDSRPCRYYRTQWRRTFLQGRIIQDWSFVV